MTDEFLPLEYSVEIRALLSMCGVIFNDRARNSVIRECCGVNEDVVM